MNGIIALLIGIALLLFLVVKTKIQAFPALIVTAITIGLLAGLPALDTISAVTAGFGNTLSSIGIVIGFGCIMGNFLEKSGAAKKMALSILRIVGVKRADIVLGLSGFLVSIPVFCDSGYVILSELAKEFSRMTKKSMVGLGGILGMGLYITHFLVPPTPGPLAVAGTLGIDLGLFIIAGLLLSIPLFMFSVPLFRWFGKKYPDLVPEQNMDRSKYSAEQLEVIDRINEKSNRGEELTSDDFEQLMVTEKLPSAFASYATIAVPILLIFANTFAKIIGIEGTAVQVIGLLGSPVVALFISVLISVYVLSSNLGTEDARKVMELSLADAGLIVFVTGAGGALGNVIKVTNIGQIMAEGILSMNMPVILVPLLIGTLMRFPQGSGTTAMITGSAIIAPMISTLGIHPLMAGLAICLTAMCPSYLNDSYFWVVTNFSGMGLKTSLKTWSVATILVPLFGSVILIITNALLF
ncbi:MAG: GntP family permease [Tissierellaceae bacterium]|nr:GntP family permease [Tissierellaceae bacterium]